MSKKVPEQRVKIKMVSANIFKVMEFHAMAVKALSVIVLATLAAQALGVPGFGGSIGLAHLLCVLLAGVLLASRLMEAPLLQSAMRANSNVKRNPANLDAFERIASVVEVLAKSQRIISAGVLASILAQGIVENGRVELTLIFSGMLATLCFLGKLLARQAEKAVDAQIAASDVQEDSP